MQQIPEEQIAARLQVENPWWHGSPEIAPHIAALKRRAYFRPFYTLARAEQPRRAVILLGPRRVGKTVMIHHAIQQLMSDGIPATRVGYISVDHPVYNGLSLERLVLLFRGASGWDGNGPSFLFFDEIQYLRDWERHLKVLVDQHIDLKFIASGSAAAALRLKSNESGAGRFTEFPLPPLTFHEYLLLLDQQSLFRENARDAEGLLPVSAVDIQRANEAFFHYLNFGGYPEVLFSPAIQLDMPRFIKSDIVDKVLLRDLPMLYGISDIQELNSLFTALAYNTAQEISLEELSQNSGVAKNTIKRYIEYLEAAFLIRIVHRVDQSGRRFRRANFFKAYLTNPSIRSALFAPIGADDPAAGALVETALFSQWFHGPWQPYYARWKGGEVDLVHPKQVRSGKQADAGFLWAVEVKWSDRYPENPRELAPQIEFCRKNALPQLRVTTRSLTAHLNIDDIRIEFVPAATYCYLVGMNRVRGAAMHLEFAGRTTPESNEPAPS